MKKKTINDLLREEEEKNEYFSNKLRNLKSESKQRQKKTQDNLHFTVWNNELTDSLKEEYKAIIQKKARIANIGILFGYSKVSSAKQRISLYRSHDQYY